MNKGNHQRITTYFATSLPQLCLRPLKVCLLAILSNLVIHPTSLGQVNLSGTPFPKLKQGEETSATANKGNITTHKINTFRESKDIPKALAKQKDAIARWYGMSGSEFDKKCQQDKCVNIDEDGRLFHACAGLALTQKQAEDLMNNQKPPTFDYDIETHMAFELESLPGAERTIYLDFDGHVTKNTFWNNNDRPEIIHPPMDLDRTPDEFTEYEKQAIINIWKQVSEDFSPYKVNVTTKEPPLEKLIKFNNTDQEYGIRVVIGGNGRNFLNASYGGIAYIGSFAWANDTPTFAFSDNLGRNPKFIAEVISHEVGHTAGLWHHGRTDGTTYHSGDGEWAPIMGVSYGARVGQWSRGEYPLANNKNDDMLVMSQYMPFKENIESNPLHNPILGEPIYGTIHHPFEVDSFFLNLKEGQITIRAELAPVYPNTDLWMNLKDPKGNIISTHKFYPLPFHTLKVQEGHYTLELFGHSFPGAGNSSYGSTGEYKLTVTQDLAIAKITNAEIDRTNDKLKISNLTLSNDSLYNHIEFSYQWQKATYNAPNNFVDITDATSPELFVSNPTMLGKYIRAIIKPHIDDFDITPFITAPIKLTNPAPKTINRNDYLEFTSNLTLPKDTLETKPIIINELSQGHSFGNNPEWIEFLTLKEVDLRGFKLKTKGKEILEFKNTSRWANIPEGTLVVIYNGKEKDPLIPPDTFLPHSQRLIIAGSSDPTLFEGNWAKLQAPQREIAINTGFENNNKTSYTTSTLNIDGVNWILNDTLIGADDRDMKEGSKSLRVRNGSIETLNYINEGIGEISFLYARANFSGDRTGTSPTFQVYYLPNSTDPSVTWIPIGNSVNVHNDNLMEFKAKVNFDGEYKIRIEKISGTKDKRWNIDNLQVTKSETMNFIKVLNINSEVIQEITFGYSQLAPKKGFLLPNITESFTSGNPLEINNGNLWEANLWAKNNFSISPGRGNSSENTDLVFNLSSETQGQLPHYSLTNAPEGIHIDSLTGRVYGKALKGGFFNLKIGVSNGHSSLYETVPLIIKQTFKEAFEDYPEVVSNPNGDFNGNGIPNLVEFALGNNPKIETSLTPISELQALALMAPTSSPNQHFNTNQSTQPNQPNQPSQSTELALSISYTRNKVASGVEIIPQWSSDLIHWNTNGITTIVTGQNEEIESLISWIPISAQNTTQQQLFMRISVEN